MTQGLGQGQTFTKDKENRTFRQRVTTRTRAVFHQGREGRRVRTSILKKRHKKQRKW